MMQSPVHSPAISKKIDEISHPNTIEHAIAWNEKLSGTRE
jgi:desulfoferrodoxin (superoxide reductase-like protein)